MALFAREAGSGGHTVVLLHGFGSSHEVWKPIEAALGINLHTLAYDLPGHGGSAGYPEAGPAKIAVKALLADFAARNLARVHLVGHSMGGAVAALIALAEPERVASLTLLAPGGFGPEINLRLLHRYAAAADEQALRPCLEAMFGWMSPIPDETVASTLAARGPAGRLDVLARVAAALGRDGRQGEIPRARLAGLAMPVSVAWGGLDNVLPPHQMDGLPPHFALHRFPELGHMLPEEAPDLMSAIIRRNASICE